MNFAPIRRVQIGIHHRNIRSKGRLTVETLQFPRSFRVCPFFLFFLFFFFLFQTRQSLSLSSSVCFLTKNMSDSVTIIGYTVGWAACAEIVRSDVEPCQTDDYLFSLNEADADKTLIVLFVRISQRCLLRGTIFLSFL